MKYNKKIFNFLLVSSDCKLILPCLCVHLKGVKRTQYIAGCAVKKSFVRIIRFNVRKDHVLFAVVPLQKKKTNPIHIAKHVDKLKQNHLNALFPIVLLYLIW